MLRAAARANREGLQLFGLLKRPWSICPESPLNYWTFELSDLCMMNLSRATPVDFMLLIHQHETLFWKSRRTMEAKRNERLIPPEIIHTIKLDEPQH